MKEAAIIILCYLIGAIPFSYLSGLILGKVDIRSQGSGNVGATNVFRTTGIPIALLALLGDLFKGFAAAWISFSIGGLPLAAICSLAAVIGHCYPVFLSFRGGKGVATAAGVLLYLMPNIVLILAVTFVVTIAVSRYVSLGSLLAAAILPLLTIILIQPWPYILVSFLLSALVIYRHRENIQRLREGKETKINNRV